MTLSLPTATSARFLFLAVLAGAASGAVTAGRDVVEAVGLVAGGAFVVSVFFGFRSTLVFWIPSFFVPFLAPGNMALKAGAAVAGAALVVTLVREWDEVRRGLHVLRPFLAVGALFLAWLMLTALWARRPDMVLSQLPWYGVSLGVFYGLIAGVRNERHLRLVVGAFVVGAAITALLALAGVNGEGDALGGSVDPSTNARWEGGTGDPNVFAAAVIAATALAGGLAAGGRRWFTSVVLALSVALFGIAAAGSQSRGGLIAAAVSLLAALLVLRRHRAKVLGLAMVVLAAAAAWTFASPGGLDRFVAFDDKGEGRSELWRIAEQMARDNPVLGVGLENFIPRAPEYVLSPGELEFILVIVEQPVVVHNTYLQFLAETGIVGLGLFLTLVFMCLRSMLLAARWFERADDPDLATLCRSTFVAAIALLTTGFFFSSAVDYKVWAVLALGPAALSIAHRRAQTAPVLHPIDVRMPAASSLARQAPPAPGSAPRVAIIVRCYNHGWIIDDALRSLSEQEPHELVVVDDGSTDPTTLAHLDRLRRDGVRVLRHEGTNPSSARMMGVRETSAPYIYPLESDDAIPPHALAYLADTLDGDPTIGVTWGYERTFGGLARLRAAPDALDPWAITYVNHVPAASLIRRGALDDVGGWALEHGDENWDLWMSLAERGWRGLRVNMVAHLSRMSPYRTSADAVVDDTRSIDGLRTRHRRLFEARPSTWLHSSAPMRMRILFPLLDALPLSAHRRTRLAAAILEGTNRTGAAWGRTRSSRTARR